MLHFLYNKWCLVFFKGGGDGMGRGGGVCSVSKGFFKIDIGPWSD